MVETRLAASRQDGEPEIVAAAEGGGGTRFQQVERALLFDPSREDGVVKPFAAEVGYVLHERHDQRMRVILARRKLRLE